MMQVALRGLWGRKLRTVLTALSIVLGSVLDGIPESMVIGLTIFQGGGELKKAAATARRALVEELRQGAALLKPQVQLTASLTHVNQSVSTGGVASSDRSRSASIFVSPYGVTGSRSASSVTAAVPAAPLADLLGRAGRHAVADRGMAVGELPGRKPAIVVAAPASYVRRIWRTPAWSLPSSQNVRPR